MPVHTSYPILPIPIQQQRVFSVVVNHRRGGSAEDCPCVTLNCRVSGATMSSGLQRRTSKTEEGEKYIVQIGEAACVSKLMGQSMCSRASQSAVYSDHARMTNASSTWSRSLHRSLQEISTSQLATANLVSLNYRICQSNQILG